MELKFKKYKPGRIFQNVVAQIQQSIMDGTLKPGDTLPPEMKLKDMFETSRGTVREALRVLEQKGLIDIRTGASGGAVVKDVGTEQITENLSLLMQYQKVTLSHIAEFREGVEGAVAALAAQKAGKADILRLKKLLARIEELFPMTDSYMEAFMAIDIRFHVVLAEIADNPIYLANVRMIHEVILGDEVDFSAKGKSVLMENHRDLSALVSAVERGDALDAEKRARSHARKFQLDLKSDYAKRA